LAPAEKKPLSHGLQDETDETSKPGPHASQVFADDDETEPAAQDEHEDWPGCDWLSPASHGKQTSLAALLDTVPAKQSVHWEGLSTREPGPQGVHEESPDAATYPEKHAEHWPPSIEDEPAEHAAQSSEVVLPALEDRPAGQSEQTPPLPTEKDPLAQFWQAAADWD
jgi:hypothetical protein